MSAQDQAGAAATTETAKATFCPRCRAPIDQPFYGPCPACRDALRVRYGGEARDVDVEAYEPKMNVTANAVATKDN